MGLYFIQSAFILLLSLIQEILGARCNTGYTYLSIYKYCTFGCCTGYTTSYKCCTSTYSSSYFGSSSNSYTYYYGYRLTSGPIAGIAVSALIGVGILIALIICCTCSKKRHGVVLRRGGTGAPNVTVVSSSMMQQGGMQPGYNYNQYNNYNNQMRGPGFYPQPLPGQPIQQPLQPNNTTQPPGLPPSYSQIGQYSTINPSYNPPPTEGVSNPGAAPPAYQYTNPAGPQYPASNPAYDQSNLINVSPYAK